MAEKISDGEVIRQLLNLTSEINSLRRRLAEVEPKAHAYDNLSKLLMLIPDSAQHYMSIDVVSEADDLISVLSQSKEEPANDPSDGAPPPRKRAKPPVYTDDAPRDLAEQPVASYCDEQPVDDRPTQSGELGPDPRY